MHPAQDPPPPFEIVRSSAFLDRIGPLYVDPTADPPRFGAYVAGHHLNTMGGAHGGFLAGLVDVAAGRGTRAALDPGRGVRTVSMTIDYVSGAAAGDWVELAVSVDRVGRRTIFTSCRVTTGGVLVARASVLLTPM